MIRLCRTRRENEKKMSKKMLGGTVLKKGDVSSVIPPKTQSKQKATDYVVVNGSRPNKWEASHTL